MNISYTFPSCFPEKVEADGLRLNLSPWQLLHIVLPEAVSAHIDDRASAMGDEESREAITTHPYWEKGWQAFVERSRTASEGLCRGRVSEVLSQPEKRALAFPFAMGTEPPGHAFGLLETRTTVFEAPGSLP